MRQDADRKVTELCTGKTGKRGQDDVAGRGQEVTELSSGMTGKRGQDHVAVHGERESKTMW
jgi:hypothetical protein